MAENNNTIIHSRYRYKPDGTDKYVIIHFETSSNDVMMEDNPDQGITGDMNLNDLAKMLMDLIEERALAPIYKPRNTLILENPVLAQGQFGIESDTGKFKIGNGSNKWLRLPYANEADSSDKVTVVASDYATLNGDNPIIPLNTYCVELDTKRVKLGNGITKYNDLKYLDITAVDSTFKYYDNPAVIEYSTTLEKSSFIPFNKQIVLEINTSKFKTGDGETVYKELPYGDTDAMHITDVGIDNTTVIDENELCIKMDAGVVTGDTVLGNGVSSLGSLTDANLRFTDSNDNELELLSLIDESDNDIKIEMTPVIKDTEESILSKNTVLPENHIVVASNQTYNIKLGNGYSRYRGLQSLGLVLADDEGEYALDDLVDDSNEESVLPEVNDALAIDNPYLLEDELSIENSHSYITKIADGVNSYENLNKFEPITNINNKIVLFDNAEEFDNNQPIMPKDSLGVELDTAEVKLGDGTSIYADLPYMNNIYG